MFKWRPDMLGKCLDWPDRRITEDDIADSFLSAELAEGRPHLSAEDREMKQFEKCYAHFLRRPEVRALDAVEQLRLFLSIFPEFRTGSDAAFLAKCHYDTIAYRYRIAKDKDQQA